MRLIDVAGALSSERREEVRARNQDPPACPAAPRGDEDTSQGALENPAARRTRPEAGVALRSESGRHGGTRRTKDGTISEGSENLPATSMCASHDPPWKRCEAPRAVCDRGAVAARGPADKPWVPHSQALGTRRAPSGDAVSAVSAVRRAGERQRPDTAHRTGHGSLCNRGSTGDAPRLRRSRKRPLA
nr:unnamed protein product [Leishmania braziliensis]